MRKRGYFVYSLISCLCIFFSIIGHTLEKNGNIFWTVSYLVTTMGISILGGIVIGIVIAEICLVKKIRIRETSYEIKRINMPDAFFWFLSFTAIFLSWVPFFLAFYPGNCTYDIADQIRYMLSHHYNAHHPLIHTLLMEMFIRIGQILQDANLGMAFYILFQMMWLASAFSYGIVFLRKLQVKKGWLIFLQVWSMLFLPHGYLSVSTTKDIIFTAEVLYMIFFFYRIFLIHRNSLKMDKWDVCLVVHGILVVLFRNNGKYAMVVTVCVLWIAILVVRENRKFYVRATINCFLILGIGTVLLTVMSYMTNAEHIRKEEMLSVPIQQFSRVLKYHENELNEEELSLLDDFFVEKSYKYYTPSISDPVKSRVNLVIMRQNVAAFAKLYFVFLKKYPGDMVNAVLALDAGYLNPLDMTHQDVYGGGASWIPIGWSLEGQFGLHRDAIEEDMYQAMKKFADKNEYDKIPIAGYLIMPGGYLWMLTFLISYLWWKKQYAQLIILSFPVGYYITLFLGPTVQLRYIYTIMVLIPFLYAIMMGRKKLK